MQVRRTVRSLTPQAIDALMSARRRDGRLSLLARSHLGAGRGARPARADGPIRHLPAIAAGHVSYETADKIEQEMSVSRFIVQLQPADGVAEVVGPVEAVFAAGRSSRTVSAEENHRRGGSTDIVVRPSGLAWLRPVNRRS